MEWRVLPIDKERLYPEELARVLRFQTRLAVLSISLLAFESQLDNPLDTPDVVSTFIYSSESFCLFVLVAVGTPISRSALPSPRVPVLFFCSYYGPLWIYIRLFFLNFSSVDYLEDSWEGRQVLIPSLKLSVTFTDVNKMKRDFNKPQHVPVLLPAGHSTSLSFNSGHCDVTPSTSLSLREKII